MREWGREGSQLRGYELSVPFGYLLDGSQSRPGRWSYIPVPVWNRTSVFHSITSHFKNSIVHSETERYFVLKCVNVLFTLKVEVNTLLAYLVTGKNRDISVGIATRYGLDGTGIESRWGRDFPHPSRPTMGGPSSHLHNWYQAFPWGKAAGAWLWPPTPISRRG